VTEEEATMENGNGRPLAVVTGASSGIGLELSREFVENDFDVIMAADGQDIEVAAAGLRQPTGTVLAVQADLADPNGVEQLYRQIEELGRPVDALCLNAGIGVAGPFIETPLEDHLRLIDLNVTGAVHLARLVLPGMAARGEGGVLFTSSIAAEMPQPYLSTYAASKAFLLSFAEGLRAELKDAGVTVTALLPGPTDTNFFARAGMEDTKLAELKRDDPRDVARDGFKALMKGKDHIVAGSLRNKAQVMASQVMADKAVAAVQKPFTKPGSGKE
jgi:short-subunit dehydrogenase